MNKKIKKILKDLELCHGFYDFIIEPDDSQCLVDYIKSLQQENKQLKDAIDMFLYKVDKNKMLLNNPDLLDLYLKIKEVSE